MGSTFDSSTDSDQVGDTVPPDKLRVMQIIAGALLFGVMSFAVIATVIAISLRQNAAAQPKTSPVITWAAMGMFAISAPLSFLLPPVIVRSGVAQIAKGGTVDGAGASAPIATKLLAIWQTSSVIGLAIIEGSAFFGGVALMLEHRWEALGVVLAAVMLMVLRFPTRTRAQAWLSDRLDDVEIARRQTFS